MEQKYNERDLLTNWHHTWNIWGLDGLVDYGLIMKHLMVFTNSVHIAENNVFVLQNFLESCTQVH